MKIIGVAFVAGLAVASAAHANDANGTQMKTEPAWPSSIHALNISKGGHVEVAGSLARGKRIADFGVPGGCAKDMTSDDFSGNHVLYGLTLPANTEVTITLTPEGADKPATLYAYTLPANRFDMPTRSAASANPIADCQSSLAERAKVGGPTHGEPRTIHFAAMPTTKNLVIGVAGPDDETSARFNVSVFEGK